MVAAATGEKRGPKPTFTVQDVVREALELGVSVFTLSSVARRLGVSTPSLYRVVPSRDVLLERCLHEIGSDFVLTCNEHGIPHDGEQGKLSPRSWQHIIESHSSLLWALLDKYPGLAQTITTCPWARNYVRDYRLQLVDALIAAGIPGQPEDIDFIIGCVGDAVILTHISSDQLGDQHNVSNSADQQGDVLQPTGYRAAPTAAVPGASITANTGADTAAVPGIPIAANPAEASTAAPEINLEEPYGTAVDGANILPLQLTLAAPPWVTRKIRFIIRAIEAGAL